MFLRTGLTQSGGAQERLWDKAVKRILAACKTGAGTYLAPKSS